MLAKVLSIVLIFGGSIAFAADSLAPLESRLKSTLPQGWSVKSDGKQIIIRREMPVKFANVIVNGPAVSTDEDHKRADEQTRSTLHEQAYRLTLVARPLMALAEYDKLKADNGVVAKERDALEQKIARIPHKFDDYLPATPEDKKLLADVRAAEKALKFHDLPDVYSADNAFSLKTSWRDGWEYVYDPNDSAECETARNAVTKLLGVYDSDPSCRTIPGRYEGQ